MSRAARVAVIWCAGAIIGGAAGWAVGYGLSCGSDRPPPGGPMPLTSGVLTGCGNAVRAILLQGGGGLVGGAAGLLAGVLATGRRTARVTPAGGVETGPT